MELVVDVDELFAVFQQDLGPLDDLLLLLPRDPLWGRRVRRKCWLGRGGCGVGVQVISRGRRGLERRTSNVWLASG